MKHSLRWIVSLVVALTLAAGGRPASGKDDDDDKQPQPAQRAAPVAQETNGVVSLSVAAIAANHVQSVAVRRSSAYVTTRVPGRIEFNPNATAEVHASLEGRLLEWLVGVGDAVHKGDVLARIDGPQNLGAPTALKAPADGEIIARNPAVGAWIQPVDTLTVVTDLSTMLVAAQVREDLVGAILTNAPAAVRVLAFPDATSTGRFLRISASVDPQTRTVDFWFAVPNGDRQLRAGMFASVALATDRVEDQLLVPEEAVQTVHDRSVVFVEEQPGKYRMAAVQLGRTVGATLEVLDGLDNGARVVAAGSFILKSEALRAELTGDSD